MRADLLCASPPEAIADEARAAERSGLDGFLVPETRHDALASLGLAAAATEDVEIGSSIAIAFARTPMTVAIASWDLQRLSRGRLLLGIGSQIRPHVTNRFGMPWSQPAARMREFVSALRAIWACWQDGTRLDFRGDFYTHTLMTPMFDPGPLPSGSPRVLVAAVGERMVRVAAEVGDGVVCHPLCSPDYLRDALLPAVAQRRAQGGFELSGMVMAATGRDERELRAAVAATRRQVAFYASTPAYLPILERHGLAPLQAELNALSKRGAWKDMEDLIDDDTLELFAVVGEPGEIGRLVRRRFDGLLDRVSLSMPYDADLDLRLAATEGLT